MAAITPPSWLQNAAHSAKSDRLTLASLLQVGATSLSTRGGIRASGDGLGLAVQAAGTPNNTVTVRSGTAYVSEAAGSGVYTCHNDASVTLTVSAASTTQSRRDLVVAQVNDAEVSGSANDWSLQVVTGTPSSGTAVAPAVPQNAIALAEVLIPAGSSTAVQNAHITDRRSTSVALGGVMPVTLATLPTNPFRGMTVWVTDAEDMRIWNGSAWRIQSYFPLPDPILQPPAAATNTITAANWAQLPNRQFVNFTAAKAMWVDIRVGAWVSAGVSTNGRAAASLTGATTGPGTNGVLLDSSSWGEVLFQGDQDGYSQSFSAIPVKLNAGTTLVEVYAYRVGAGTTQVNYPTIRVVPLRYA